MQSKCATMHYAMHQPIGILIPDVMMVAVDVDCADRHILYDTGDAYDIDFHWCKKFFLFHSSFSFMMLRQRDYVRGS